MVGSYARFYRRVVQVIGLPAVGEIVARDRALAEGGRAGWPGC
jgi:hypothetical protein